jgi:UDP-N-acetylmuramoyl-tripeptide--D-alanyl-D-alanine ligase
MSAAQTVMMHATDAAAWMAGAHLAGPDAAIHRVTTDSRAVQPGDLFVALIGERVHRPPRWMCPVRPC